MGAPDGCVFQAVSSSGARPPDTVSCYENAIYTRGWWIKINATCVIRDGNRGNMHLCFFAPLYKIFSRRFICVCGVCVCVCVWRVRESATLCGSRSVSVICLFACPLFFFFLYFVIFSCSKAVSVRGRECVCVCVHVSVAKCCIDKTGPYLV